MVLKPGVNFINILRAAFTGTQIPKVQKDIQVVSLFCSKAACRMLMKLTPDMFDLWVSQLHILIEKAI